MLLGNNTHKHTFNFLFSFDLSKYCIYNVIMKQKKCTKTVCIFCSSSMDVSDSIKTAGSEFVTLLAKENCGVLYGGTICGLMGIIAKAHKNANGHLTGVIPRYMIEQGLAFEELDETIVVDDLRPRKQKMLDHSDVIVALPGGVGTYDEFFDLLTLKQLKRHSKPMYLFNIDGYFQPLLNLFEHGVVQNTIKTDNYDLFQVANSATELIKLIQSS